MILRLMLLSFLLCFFTHCRADFSEPRQKVSSAILIQFEKQMRKKGLYVAGKGGGCTREKKINLIDVTFDYFEEMDVIKARELIVESTNVLLDLINSDPNHEKYFDVFPATPNVISISILGPTTPDPDEHVVAAVRIKNGEICYNANGKGSGGYQPYIEIHRETFEEAKKILCKSMLLKLN